MKIRHATVRLMLEDGLWEPDAMTEEKSGFSFADTEHRKQAAIDILPWKRAQLVKVKGSIENHPFRDSMNLVCDSPVRLRFDFGRVPDELCVQYQHRDWWSRPAWPAGFAEVPERTQCMLYRTGKKYGCIFPMTGEKMKAYLGPGSKKELGVFLTAYAPGISEFDEPCFMIAEAENVYEAARLAVEAACDYRNIPVKGERRLPEMFEYLGWCSWDAFYTDISEQKVLDKAKELKKKRIPVRWILMDDGWLNTENSRLKTFSPDPVKFPSGFADMNERLKKDGTVRWVGVWHALAGYWGGVLPGSEAAKECAGNLYETRNGKLIPHYEAEKGFGFYRKWYEYLKKQGIDFVKVDGQSALKNYYKNNVEIGKAAAGTQQALDAAAELYMNGNLINCMGMAVENMLSRPVSAVSRNSDDFTPQDPESFPEHILQNAYNAIFHDNLYYCDWDMFWTHHKDAGKHAVVRAVSGGPVYVSDRIGDSERDEIMPLVYSDGRLLRMERSAMPSSDVVFRDPTKGGAMKLTNTIRGCGAVAVLNLCGRKSVDAEVSPKDVYGLDEKAEYGIYDVQRRAYRKPDMGESVSVSLGPEDYRLFLFLKAAGRVVPIGLLDKYICVHAVVSCTETNDRAVILVREGGKFGFAVDKTFSNVIVNGEDVTERIRVENGFYSVMVPEGKTGIVEVLV